VIVVCENGPLLDGPPEFLESGQNRFFKEVESIIAAEVMLLLVGARSDDVGAGMRDDMRWSVGPVLHCN